MSVRDLPAEELIELALEAIGEHSPERLRPLIDPEVRVVTERGIHEGADAVLAWAAKGYENLNRRFALDALDPIGTGLLGSGRVEYVWRDTGEVGDASPIFLALRLSGEGLLAGLSLHEERAGAVADLRD
jgi:hypothetical protein